MPICSTGFTPARQAPTGYDVLKMATRGSARLLGRDDIGQLAVGKCADLFLVDSRRLELVGGEYSPADVLATVGLRGPVDYTVIQGRVVVKERHLTTIDEAKVAEDARRCCRDVPLPLISPYSQIHAPKRNTTRRSVLTKMLLHFGQTA